MTRTRATVRWAAALAVAFAAAATAAGGARVRTAVDEVQVRTDAKLDSLTVGQRFHVFYRFTYADSLRSIEPKKLHAGTCRAISVAWSETRKEHRVDRTADATFIPLSVDSSVVPANAFDFLSAQGDTIRAWSEDVRVPIKRIAANAKDLNPLKAQWKAPPNYWLWGAIVAAVLAAVALLVWWIRKRRARDGTVRPELRLPPEVIALAELERIAGLGLPARGEYKTHYTLVVDALRRYLEARYGIEAMDLTTFELMDALERREIHVAGLASILDEADLVKFAKFAPSAENAARVLNRARETVIATTPVAPAPDILAPSQPSQPSAPVAGAS